MNLEEIVGGNKEDEQETLNPKEHLRNNGFGNCETKNLGTENISNSATNEVIDCEASAMNVLRLMPCSTKIDIKDAESDIRRYKNDGIVYQQDPKTSCIDHRNIYTDDVFGIDADTYDQPIDYSRKYSETKPAPRVTRDNKIMRKSEIPKQSQYGDYQETDLDQVTDYSLRYAENNLKSAWEVEEEEYDVPESNFVLEDTVKCYYTEGTPYETPCNISTATSMSDLRLSSNHDDEKTHKSNIKKLSNINVEKVVSLGNELATKKQTNSEEPDLVFDLSSPEKPLNYSERDTTEYFSKLSLDAKDEEDGNDLNNTEEKNDNIEETYTPEKIIKENKHQPSTDVDGKITFASALNSAQETPLMFSRSSSLTSLSSVELPDVPDDWSSVISDFSRLNSGFVSPSELPDSPTQIIQTNRVPTAEHIYHNNSIFQDQVKSFGEESTPAVFSTATSLSALTIIDDKKSNIDTVDIDNKSEKDEENHQTQSVVNKDIIKTTGDDIQIYCTEDTPAILSKIGSYSDLSDISVPDDENLDEITEDKRRISWSDDSSILSGESTHLLEECIKSGMSKPIQSIPTSIENYPSKIRDTNLLNYWSAKDEIGRYNVEDSPCNFSVVSGLSDLTVNSTDKAAVADLKTARVETLNESQQSDGLHQEFAPNIHEEFHSFSDEDMQASKLSAASSLSSISISSNEDDSILLNFAISEGISKAGSKCENLDWDKSSIHSVIRQIPSFTNLQSRNQTDRGGSSSSSVESLEEGDQALFEQCIKSGLPKEKTEQKLTKKLKPRSLEQLFASQKVEQSVRNPRSHSDQRLNSQQEKSDPNRRSTRSTERPLKQVRSRQNYTVQKYSHVSQLPTYNDRLLKKSQKPENSVKYNKDEIDQQILEECINSGMPKRKSLVDSQNKRHRFNRQMDRM